MNQRPGNEWHRFCLLRAHYLRLGATFVPCPVLQGRNSAPQYLNISGPVSWSFTPRNERACSSFCSLSRVWKLSELVAISQILQECLFWGLGPLWASAAGHPPAHIAGLLSWPSVRLKCSLSLGWRDTGYPRWTSGHKHYRLSEFLVQGPFSTGCSRWLLVALELCLKSSKIVFPQPTTPAEPPTHSPVARSCSGNICHMVGLWSSDPASYVHMDCFRVQVAIKKKKAMLIFQVLSLGPDWSRPWYLCLNGGLIFGGRLRSRNTGQLRHHCQRTMSAPNRRQWCLNQKLTANHPGSELPRSSNSEAQRTREWWNLRTFSSETFLGPEESSRHEILAS